MSSLYQMVVLIKGGGEMASAVAHRLHRSHFRVCLTETAQPLAVSRGTTFSEAVFDGIKTVEGVSAEMVPCSLAAVEAAWRRGHIPLVIDPECQIKDRLNPAVLVDARSLKRKTDTRITDAPLVIGLGPGFCAGRDCHVVIETLHDNSLGRVISEGEAVKDTKAPVAIAGLSSERVVWAEQEGLFRTNRCIGDSVKASQNIARLGQVYIKAPVAGMLRGLLRNGVTAPRGAKLVEVDPVNDASVCGVIRDKWRSVAGGVLEAVAHEMNQAV